MVDKDGFIILERKPQVKAAPKDDGKKPSKKPFKKGSWKNWLFKKLKSHKSGSSVSEFHYLRTENVIIYRKSKPRAILSKKKFKDDVLGKLERKYPDDCFVMINAGDGIFLKISLKCYMNLMKIKKMIVSMRLVAVDDDEKCEPYTVYETDRVITSINDLMCYINYTRQLIGGVGDVQMYCYGFTEYQYKFKTVVLHTDGSVKAFKGDFNEVLTEYGITPLL